MWHRQGCDRGDTDRPAAMPHALGRPHLSFLGLFAALARARQADVVFAVLAVEKSDLLGPKIRKKRGVKQGGYDMIWGKNSRTEAIQGGGDEG